METNCDKGDTSPDCFLKSQQGSCAQPVHRFPISLSLDGLLMQNSSPIQEAKLYLPGNYETDFQRQTEICWQFQFQTWFTHLFGLYFSTHSTAQTLQVLCQTKLACKSLTTYLAARSGRIPWVSEASYCSLDCPDPSCPWPAVPDNVAPPPGLRNSAEWQTVGASWWLGGSSDCRGEILKIIMK